MNLHRTLFVGLTSALLNCQTEQEISKQTKTESRFILETRTGETHIETLGRFCKKYSHYEDMIRATSRENMPNSPMLVSIAESSVEYSQQEIEDIRRQCDVEASRVASFAQKGNGFGNLVDRAADDERKKCLEKYNLSE